MNIQSPGNNLPSGDRHALQFVPTRQDQFASSPENRFSSLSTFHNQLGRHAPIIDVDEEFESESQSSFKSTSDAILPPTTYSPTGQPIITMQPGRIIDIIG